MRTEISSVAELPEMHLMGHTCTNLNGDLIFVWGGTSESIAYSNAQNTDLWIYETLTGYWRHRKCSGECPPYLSSCSSALIGQKMYVFGGHSTSQDNWLNSLYCLDLSTFVWRDLGASARGEPTKPIRSDKNVAWSYGNKMYVFGGYGWSQVEHYLELADCQADLQLVPDHRWPKFGWNNQLVEFDPADRTWRWPCYRGKCPSARAAHSGALMGNRYFVFGGRDSHERLNDLYTLDMDNLLWQKVAVLSLGRFESSLTNDRRLSGRRAIGHLLEGAEDDDVDDQLERGLDELAPNGGGAAYNQDADEQNDDEAAESHRQLVEEMHDVEMEDEWEFTPSSSSTAAQLIGEQVNDISGQSGATTTATAAGGHGDDNDDDDDGGDFGHQHSSRLHERWSLSAIDHHDIEDESELAERLSHGLTAEPNDPDCLLEAIQNRHQQGQEQNFMSMTGRAQEPPQAGAEHSSELTDRGQDDDELGQSEQQQPQPHNADQRAAAHAADQDQLASGADERGQVLSPPNIDGVNPTGPLPAGRSFCSLTPISDESMLLFGGVDSQDKNLDDCWLFNISTNCWTQIADYKHRRSRLWHTGARTKQHEVVIMGGSSSEKIDEYCTDVLVMSFEAKSLKRLALDTVSRSVRMKTIQRARGIPSTLVKLIKLRKQAMALTMRRSASQRQIISNAP